MNYVIQTPHYKFKLRVEDMYAPIHKRKFTIGDAKGLCLDASVFMPDVDERFRDILDTCTIHNLDALEECLLHSEPGSKSIGVEILYAFISILKANHPYVKRITFRDASYIPCNRVEGDTLDLLTYNLALYGKTWYESKAGAHVEKNQDKYEKERNYYATHAKQDTSWDAIWKIIVTKNDFAATRILADELKFKEAYDASSTLPEFMIRMRDIVGSNDKCKFFKGWLEIYMRMFVSIERDWVIDLENDTLKHVNVSKSRPMSRKTKTRRHDLNSVQRD